MIDAPRIPEGDDSINIEYRSFKKNEGQNPPQEVMRAWADMLSEHSWGWDYPVKPIDEISKAEFVVAAFAGEKLVGAACINRYASPEPGGRDNGEMWFSGTIVLPHYRRLGIYKNLYDVRLAYALSQPGRILASTENPDVEQGILPRRGWKVIRTSTNEAGGPTTILEFERAEQIT